MRPRSLTDIVTQLKGLAVGGSEGEVAIRRLADELERRRSNLAGIDLSAVYAPAVMLPEGTRRWRLLTETLELIRDVLVFIPVIYTWARISQALNAYNAYQGKEPFLLAWQKGFGGKIEPLSTAAVVVALIVLAVVFMTLVAHVVRTRYDQSVEQRQQLLAVLLAEASLLLSSSVGNAPDVTKAELATIGTRISTSANSLQEALKKVGGDITSAVNTSPGSKLHEMFEKWTAAANELKTLGTRLQGTQEMVNQLRATQVSLSGMSSQIGGDTDRLLKAMEQERSLSRHEAHAHHELAVQVGESTKALGESLKGLTERSEQFNELVLRLAYIIDGLEEDNDDPNPGGGYP